MDVLLQRQAVEVLGALARAQMLFGDFEPEAVPKFVPPADLENDLGAGRF